MEIKSRKIRTSYSKYYENYNYGKIIWYLLTVFFLSHLPHTPLRKTIIFACQKLHYDSGRASSLWGYNVIIACCLSMLIISISIALDHARAIVVIGKLCNIHQNTRTARQHSKRTPRDWNSAKEAHFIIRKHRPINCLCIEGM